MTRICLSLAFFAAACSPNLPSPPSGVAQGEKRWAAGATSHLSGKVRPRHRSLSTAASRHLSRRPRPVLSLRLVVTAYCATGSRNAAGNWPTVGTAAANAYPLGTRLAVEGHGIVTVEDRSAPGMTDVDLYLGSDAGCPARAAAFGRQVLGVAVVR